MESKNALTELAEEMQEDMRMMYAHGKIRERMKKAQRIVAELAKVEKPIDLRTVGMTHLADILEADTNRAVEIVRNCRAIAEEGAGDGK